MSSTNRGARRNEQDFYATPAWCVKAILPHLPQGAVLDPCCGDGAILKACDGMSLEGIEIDESRALKASEIPYANIVHGDAFKNNWPPTGILITNPPYSLAIEFVEVAVAWSKMTHGTAALLLRLNFLASKSRVEFHRKHPADVYVLSRRPSFTGGSKTDSCEYAWLVWGPGRGGRWFILDCPSAAESKQLEAAE